MPLYYTDEQLISTALDMWANNIETGDLSYSAELAAKCGKPGIIRGLNTDQMRLVVRLRDLAVKVLSGEPRGGRYVDNNQPFG